MELPRLLILRKRRTESTDFSSFSSYAQRNEDETRIHGEPRKADKDGHAQGSPHLPLQGCATFSTNRSDLGPPTSGSRTQRPTPAHSPPPRELNSAESPTSQVALLRCQRCAQAAKD